ncbi:hypothetical protein [Limosilactobacillus fermentum]
MDASHQRLVNLLLMQATADTDKGHHPRRKASRHQANYFTKLNKT